MSADSRITALGVGVDWPRIDKDATLVIPSRRYTLRIAGSADLVAIVNKRPTRIVFKDDCRVRAVTFYDDDGSAWLAENGL